jgi:hypothetical protein
MTLTLRAKRICGPRRSGLLWPGGKYISAAAPFVAPFIPLKGRRGVALVAGRSGEVFQQPGEGQAFLYGRHGLPIGSSTNLLSHKSHAVPLPDKSRLWNTGLIDCEIGVTLGCGDAGWRSGVIRHGAKNRAGSAWVGQRGFYRSMPFFNAKSAGQRKNGKLAAPKS